METKQSSLVDSWGTAVSLYWLKTWRKGVRRSRPGGQVFAVDAVLIFPCFFHDVKVFGKVVVKKRTKWPAEKVQR
jgi:hypothetical protein